MWSLPILATLLALTPLSLAGKKVPRPLHNLQPTLLPPKIATVTTSYPCADNTCPDGCASTSYIYASTYGNPHPTITKKPACPTVTSVLGRCSTCVMPMCMALSTIKSECGCPFTAATVTTSYACDGKCPGGCAGTEYVYDTVTPDCKGYPTAV
ncbi:hypothetical protein MRS44_002214 [Fusarium solani]|uniref:uncharacterized protein n=1 Tax=Fusarium solani TaxID=169388 RepID=UPI0032C48FBF|nr:hypothetical protein MRS44_002214 [Fusarium solani]